jgi:hypothetical protein
VGQSIVAALGAWIVFQDEAGQSTAPPRPEASYRPDLVDACLTATGLINDG